jgi:hypothetical protein
MGEGLGFFHHSNLQNIALNTSIEISVEHSTHFFQHDNLSMLYDVGQLRDSLSKFDACVASTQFPPPSKQGLLLTPPRILQPSKFNVQSSGSLASETLPNLKHNDRQAHFMGEIWQHSATTEHKLVQAAQLVMDVYTQKLIRLPNFVYYGV